jgi:hypothetical protein
MPNPASTPPNAARVKLELMLDAETREALRVQAEREHRSSQGVIRALVSAHLAADAAGRGETTR